MATALDPALTKKSFNNWLKGALAVLFAKEGLTEFVRDEISDFQRDLLHSILTKNGIPLGTACSSCTTANMLKCPTLELCSRTRPCKLHDPTVANKTPNQKCPLNICHHIKDAIFNHHRFHGPTWAITDATRWCSDPFEIAKCYLPPKGYSNKTSLVEIDFNGTLGIIISNTIFQNKLAAQLNVAPNICSKVRDMINEKVRHSASYELSDIELAKIIDALRDLLQDPKNLLQDQHAKEAVIKLNQLQNNTLIICTGDISKVLEENFRENIAKQQQDALQEVQKYFDTAQTSSLAALEFIKSAALDEIRKTTDDKRQELLLWSQQQHKHNDDVLLNDLKDDLMTYYRENESMVPASPLVDEHNVPAEELYVIPPLRAYYTPYIFGPDKNTQKTDKHLRNNGQEKKKIALTQLFVSGDVRYKKIYITANAGFGKTSLSQRLTMTWCQSHFPLTSLTEHYDDEDLVAMKYFDFLFLLHLRDYQSDSKCNLDDLIMKMVSTNMSRKSQYANEFIERILHKKKCLVILDGLDEWSHPDHCTRKPEVPHNNHPDSCTVLTTTRDWKIGTVGLSPKDIDRRVEISMLDATSRNLLENNAIGILNKRNLNLVGKNIADFKQEIKRVQIGNIIYIPYILLQLMCLFFGGLPIGKSKCEMYSNITEFTLKRGLKKKNLPDIHVQSNDDAPVPNCMKQKRKCNLFFNSIMKLCKLAFYALFNQKKESSLIFDRRYAKEFMTKQEIKFFLKVGLLCQSKDNSIIAERRYKVFFQHKSLQEFFSAIHISSKWEDDTVKLNILEACSSLRSTLEMSNLFVFVCGMNPEVYTCISDDLQKIVDLDIVTRRYRSDQYSPCEFTVYDPVYHDDMRTMKSYQSMQVQCAQESLLNGNNISLINLHDIVLDFGQTEDDLTTLKEMINVMNGNVKSLLLISFSEKVKSFIESLNRGVFTSLETIRAEHGDQEPATANILVESARTLKCLSMFLRGSSLSDIKGLTCLQTLYLVLIPVTYSFESHTKNAVWLADILTECADTLKWLTLFLEESFASDIIITALTGLTCLQSLHLSNIHFTHSNMKRLYAYISNSTTLTQLKLEEIYCSDHQNKYTEDCDFTLDLNRSFKQADEESSWRTTYCGII